MHKGGFDRSWWKKAGLGLLIGLAVAAAIVSCASGDEGSFTHADAHTICDNAIKSASINSSLVEIPHKVARETPDTFGFLWRRGDGLKMPNSFGTQVDAVVICRVSKKSKKVEHLEINGEIVPAR